MSALRSEQSSGARHKAPLPLRNQGMGGFRRRAALSAFVVKDFGQIGGTHVLNTRPAKARASSAIRSIRQAR